MAAKAQVDVEALRRDYMTMTMSNNELANKHGCSKGRVTQLAKQHGWRKGGTIEIVRAEAKSRLIADSDAPEEIQVAAEAQVQVIRGHRETIARLNALVRRVMVSAEQDMAMSEAIPLLTDAEDLRLLTMPAKKFSEVRATLPDRIVQAVDLFDIRRKLAAGAARVADDLVGSAQRLIAMERQAFDIDGAAMPSDTYEERLQKLVDAGRKAAASGPEDE